MSDPRLIQDRLTDAELARLERFDAFDELPSTNTYLLERPAPATGRYRFVIADHQTAGRGRSGNPWVSPRGAGLYLSMAYTFARIPKHMPSVTIAVGVGIARYLRSLGVTGVGLKWPNDIVALDGKLGGILTETQTRGRKEFTVVTGIGLNIALSAALRRGIAASWAEEVTDLRQLLDVVPARPQLAAGVMRTLIETIGRFEQRGLHAFQRDWQSFDWLAGKSVEVYSGGGRLQGVVAGIDADGALLLRCGERTERVLSGSVRVCADSAAIA